MPTTMLEVNNLVKRYGDFTAVDHLSFEVHAGEIFGLLGPNGAGKSTTIRMIMDIIKPDEGTVSVLGRTPDQARDHVGYLPEERGLYRALKVLDVLIYLAELKGTPRDVARQRAMEWLERVELTDWVGSKVKDLSRGMQQKLQFAATLIHDPDLLIFDEPFQGLDPVNVGLLKSLIRDLAAEGKAIALSAHEMSLVEALCDRILLINRGQAVLYGELDAIRREYSPDAVRVRTTADLGQIPGVVSMHRDNGQVTLMLDGTTPQQLLRTLVERDVPVEAFEVALAPLEEIFVRVVKGGSDEL
ncbi:MAG: ATP-binding cassette domain-containing protein [Chloroflexi bacterium]|nr:ATP-binding cassette domain-containing protein [Chloroflexota bacterium]